MLDYWRLVKVMAILKDSKAGAEQQMCKPDICTWGISRNDVIVDQISRHMDKYDILRNSRQSS